MCRGLRQAERRRKGAKVVRGRRNNTEREIITRRREKEREKTENEKWKEKEKEEEKEEEKEKLYLYIGCRDVSVVG